MSGKNFEIKIMNSALSEALEWCLRNGVIIEPREDRIRIHITGYAQIYTNNLLKGINDLKKIVEQYKDHPPFPEKNKKLVFLY